MKEEKGLLKDQKYPITRYRDQISAIERESAKLKEQLKSIEEQLHDPPSRKKRRTRSEEGTRLFYSNEVVEWMEKDTTTKTVTSTKICVLSEPKAD